MSRKTALIGSAVTLLLILLPLPGYGGTIRTAITTTWNITDPGAIGLDIRIRNNGDVTAHKVAVTLLLAHVVREYDDLGDNPAGGQIHLQKELAHPGFKPGRYRAVVRVAFEEQAGRLHHAYHFFEIPYRTHDMPAPDLPLELHATDLCFNRKAFWHKDDDIALSVKNNSQENILLNARLFLPEGFTSPAPDWSFRVDAGGASTLDIPLGLDRDKTPHKPYHLLVWCDHDGAHYAWDLRGVIWVEDRPVYFKIYLVAAALMLLLFLGILLFRRPSLP
jgi:hypothetical protein